MHTIHSASTLQVGDVVRSRGRHGLVLNKSDNDTDKLMLVWLHELNRQHDAGCWRISGGVDVDDQRFLDEFGLLRDSGVVWPTNKPPLEYLGNIRRELVRLRADFDHRTHETDLVGFVQRAANLWPNGRGVLVTGRFKVGDIVTPARLPPADTGDDRLPFISAPQLQQAALERVGIVESLERNGTIVVSLGHLDGDDTEMRAAHPTALLGQAIGVTVVPEQLDFCVDVTNADLGKRLPGRKSKPPIDVLSALGLADLDPAAAVEAARRLNRLVHDVVLVTGVDVHPDISRVGEVCDVLKSMQAVAGFAVGLGGMRGSLLRNGWARFDLGELAPRLERRPGPAPAFGLDHSEIRVGESSRDAVANPERGDVWKIAGVLWVVAAVDERVVAFLNAGSPSTAASGAPFTVPRSRLALALLGGYFVTSGAMPPLRRGDELHPAAVPTGVLVRLTTTPRAESYAGDRWAVRLPDRGEGFIFPPIDPKGDPLPWEKISETASSARVVALVDFRDDTVVELCRCRPRRAGGGTHDHRRGEVEALIERIAKAPDAPGHEAARGFAPKVSADL